MTKQAVAPEILEQEPLLELDLSVTGMTCSSCVARVEKRLTRLPGVTATVNLATETAHVAVHEETSDEDIIAAVSKAGYSATITRRIDHANPEGTGTYTDAGDFDTSNPEADASLGLRTRLIVSAILSAPVLVLSMVPPLQFAGWQWIIAALALPCVTWRAWPLHRPAAGAARYGSSPMAALVSLGGSGAARWAGWALVWGGAGGSGTTRPMSLCPRLCTSAHTAPAEVYLEVAAVVT